MRPAEPVFWISWECHGAFLMRRDVEGFVSVVALVTVEELEGLTP